jgi:hypothetical protein
MNTPHTEEQKCQFIEQFKSRRTRQLMVSLPLIASIVGFSFFREGELEQIAGISSGTLGAGFLVLMVGAIAFSLKNWRCPACNGYLGRTISPRFCQKCGVQLGS